jgi:hypothetical protein
MQALQQRALALGGAGGMRRDVRAAAAVTIPEGFTSVRALSACAVTHPALNAP